MCAPTVNYSGQNSGISTKKLAWQNNGISTKKFGVTKQWHIYKKIWRGKTVAYLQKKLAFERDKSIGAATTNLQQQNPCITSGIIFVATLYFLSLTVLAVIMCLLVSLPRCIGYFCLIWLTSISYSFLLSALIR